MDRLGEVDLFSLEQVNAILNFRIEISINRLIADIDSESQLAFFVAAAEYILLILQPYLFIVAVSEDGI